MADQTISTMRIVIVAVNANTGFGGEAMLPLQYFRLLGARGRDVHLVCHERNRAALADEFPDETSRIHFTKDRLASRLIERAGMRLPRNVKSLTVWVLMGAITALDLRRTARDLVRTAPGAAVVHEPIPVSPRQPSFISRVGAPVVVGPLNGGMTYPSGFQQDVSRFETVVHRAVRSVSDLANRVIDGKGRAATILIANPRTRSALPRSTRGRHIVQLSENGVDLSVFTHRTSTRTGAPRFAFVGRLVDWKRVDLLLEAMRRLPEEYELEVVGAGLLDDELRRRAADLGLGTRVRFHGMLTQEATADVLASCDALVLPSIYECGGAVVLEAMAVGLPVIATDWGGPADYVVADETGILVPPSSAEDLAAGLAAAMCRLGEDRSLARRMGDAGRSRVEAEFDW